MQDIQDNADFRDFLMAEVRHRLTVLAEDGNSAGMVETCLAINAVMAFATFTVCGKDADLHEKIRIVLHEQRTAILEKLDASTRENKAPAWPANAMKH